MKKITLLAGTVGVLFLAACADVKTFETPPVTISTSGGPVTCQFYTTNMTYWDRATQWPQSMDYRVADAACKAEGVRRQAG